MYHRAVSELLEQLRVAQLTPFERYTLGGYKNADQFAHALMHNTDPKFRAHQTPDGQLTIERKCEGGEVSAIQGVTPVDYTNLIHPGECLADAVQRLAEERRVP